MAEAQYPWDFFLHLKEGSIIPFQDNHVLQTTKTADLQMNPVDFHILPDCFSSGTVCTAEGVYFNDDGETLNTTAFNRYHISFTMDQPTTLKDGTKQQLTSMWFKITNKQIGDLRTNDGVINANDHLSGLQIYNAAATGLNSAKGYSVSFAVDGGGTSALMDANYDATTDRLIFE